MTPITRVRAYFLVQFMSVGIVNAFGGLWLNERRLSEAQIGLIFALPIACTLLLTFTVGRMADRASDWRSAIVIGMVIAAITPFGLLFTSSFYGILVFWTLMVVAQVTTIPVVDAAGLRFGRRNGVSLGSLRALTTFGYLAVIICAGPAVNRWGLSIFLPALLSLACLRAVVAFGLPKLRAPDGVAEAAAPLPLAALKQRWFVMPLLGGSLILATVLVLNAFQAVLWGQQGIAASTIGYLIALGAAAEFAMFLIYPRIAPHFSAQKLLLAAAIITVVRWGLLAFDLPVIALIFVQLLHAFSYALTFLACANFIADNTGEDVAAQAQAALVLIQQAMGMIILLAFGWMAGLWGTQAYFALVAVAVVATLLIVTGPPRRPGAK